MSSAPERPRQRYPFAALPVGEYFEVPLAGERASDYHDRAAARLTAAAAQFARRWGRRFSCTIDRAAGVVRCERID